MARPAVLLVALVALASVARAEPAEKPYVYNTVNAVSLRPDFSECTLLRCLAGLLPKTMQRPRVLTFRIPPLACLQRPSLPL